MMNMKAVYVMRHGHKDFAGNLTDEGQQSAAALRPQLPHFELVVASGYARAIQTAQLLSGQDPMIDERAGYPMAPQDVSDTINALAAQKGLSFLEAAHIYNDALVLSDIGEQAKDLNSLIDELLVKLTDGQWALVVSHDITIVPAMSQRGLPGVPIEPLAGYVVSQADGHVTVDKLEKTTPDQ